MDYQEGGAWLEKQVTGGVAWKDHLLPLHPCLLCSFSAVMSLAASLCHALLTSGHGNEARHHGVNSLNSEPK